MYAMLGHVRFEFLNSFSDFEEKHTAVFAKHEVLAGRPRLQAMGNGLTAVRFGLRLHWQLGDVDAAYRGLIAAKEAQQAVPLVFGSGRFMGWFVIESVGSRTLIQDGSGRTAARELDVELTEFVGDPNNPLPAPAVAADGRNPLAAVLPESVRGTVSQLAEAVAAGVRLYRAAERDIGQIQDLLARARDVKNDPTALSEILADAAAVGAAALDRLNRLPENRRRFGSLDGAAQMLAYGSQAARELSRSMAAVRDGADLPETAAAAAAAAADSLADGSRGVQSLTAWLASGKDGR